MSRSYQHPSMPSGAAVRLYGRRVMLRPLAPADWPQWAEVRQRNDQWLTPWEPMRPSNLLDPTRDRDAYLSRCSARDREGPTERRANRCHVATANGAMSLGHGVLPIT